MKKIKDIIDLNIPDWQLLGYGDEEEYNNYKDNERYLVNKLGD